MDDAIAQALGHDRVIDITTTGRRSGSARRIEIWFFNLDGTLYLTGAPGNPRHWYRNLCAHPEFTVHLKQSFNADLSALAHPITDAVDHEETLRAVLALFTPEIPPEWMPGRSDAQRCQTGAMVATNQADPGAGGPGRLGGGRVPADGPAARRRPTTRPLRSPRGTIRNVGERSAPPQRLRLRGRRCAKDSAPPR